MPHRLPPTYHPRLPAAPAFCRMHPHAHAALLHPSCRCRVPVAARPRFIPTTPPFLPSCCPHVSTTCYPNTYLRDATGCCLVLSNIWSWSCLVVIPCRCGSLCSWFFSSVLLIIDNMPFAVDNLQHYNAIVLRSYYWLFVYLDSWFWSSFCQCCRSPPSLPERGGKDDCANDIHARR